MVDSAADPAPLFDPALIVERRPIGGGITLNLRRSPPDRDRPPLLLLHGFPQTHAIWHAVVPDLAAQFTLVLPDLRGYGDSDKPPTDASHAPYSKRASAADLVALMHELGHPRFGVCGHDRGGRVAHRLALDHADAVEKIMLLDIAPTLTMYEQTTMALATLYYHWFFLIQPAPLPERLIGADPNFYLDRLLGGWGADAGRFDPRAVAEYRRCFADPATRHAMCEDYRAAAGIDLEHDRRDRDAGRRIACPVRVHWGACGVIQRLFKPLVDWQAVAALPVTGSALPSGHYIPEEAPAQLAAAIREFFATAHDESA